jgi:hypothetical protein
MSGDTAQNGSGEIKVVYQEVHQGDPWYELDKLRAAIWKLATGAEGIKARLADAYIELAIIQEADLPSSVCERWKEIKSDLTRGKMQYETRIMAGELVQQPVGLLYSTLRHMRKDKAIDIAKRICALEAELSAYLKQDDPSGHP